MRIDAMAPTRQVLIGSDGVQEETTYLGVPCLAARPDAERPVTITHGTNRLAASRAVRSRPRGGDGSGVL
jgi:UDP-N-acetylglucosamine 2-epimerase (non-hydrolysing)